MRKAGKDKLLELLDAYTADEMEAYMVSRAVNNPGAKGRELVEEFKSH